jgi:hypothetical protein
MNTLTAFAMKIADVFHFADGRTVFVGPIDGDVKFIRPCKCELLIDGVPTSIIQIEGEMMPDRSPTTGYRSVSTRDAVSLSRRTLASSDCVLRPVSDRQEAGGNIGSARNANQTAV